MTINRREQLREQYIPARRELGAVAVIAEQQEYKKQKNWKEKAFCKTLNEDEQKLFFGSDELPESRKNQQQSAIRRYCRICKVREECLESANKEEPSRNNIFGVRGGMTEWQRKKYYKIIDS